MSFRRRFSIRRRLALGLAIAAVAAPAAQAQFPTSDEAEAVIAQAGSTVPDALDRYLRNNPHGLVLGSTALPTSPGIVPTPLPTAQVGSTAVPTPPGYIQPTVMPAAPEYIRPPAQPSPGSFSHDGPTSGIPVIPQQQPVASVTDDGFDWSDAGIGFGIAIGAALLAAGMAMGMRGRGKLATSH
jgi:hypothetical protein